MHSVLVLVTYKIFPPDMGGQKAVYYLYKHLQCHQNIIMCASADNEPVDACFEVVPFLHNNKQLFKNVFLLFRLKKLIRSRKVNCIIAEHSYAGWLAWLLKILTGIPFVIRSHNLEYSRFRQMNKRNWSWYQLYEGWIHRRANYSIFISDEDREQAEMEFGLKNETACTIPYGVEPVEINSRAEKLLRQQFNISSRYIFYFNGTLDYAPNEEAVEHLLELESWLSLKMDFLIVISGKNLSAGLIERIDASPHYLYTGFVEDNTLLYQGCHLFLNPVTNDSGIKTKVVEALANQCLVISMESGAAGINPNFCEDKLITVPDYHIEAFAATMEWAVLKPKKDVGSTFSHHFNWERLAEVTSGKINMLVDEG